MASQTVESWRRPIGDKLLPQMARLLQRTLNAEVEMPKALNWLLFACMACAACSTRGTSNAHDSTPQARKVAACAAALDSLSVEAEKSYRAALVAPVSEHNRAPLPVENPLARSALNALEVALAEAPSEHPLDRSARRFATAAEALLLRAREPGRRVGEREFAQSASLQALLATHELFQHSAAQLRLELDRAVRSSAVLEAMRSGNFRGGD
jgi:hypothetical protein